MKNNNTEGCLTGTFVLIATLLLTAFIIVGCSAPRQVTQPVTGVRTDTVYLSNMQYDSIYIYQDRLFDHRLGSLNLELGTFEPDTVLIREVATEYRYKLLRDTVRIVQRDSIPYEVTVTEVKEIKRPLTWFDHLCRICFGICLSGFLITVLCLIKGLRSKL